MALPYFVLKVIATIVRLVVRFQIFYRRNILRHIIDWEKAYPRVSREYRIRSSSSPREIKIRVWNPPSGVTGLRPVHINWHGSGYMIPSLGNDSDFCELLSKKLGVTVLDCDYAKAPEWPFPHAYNDVTDVIKHVLSQPMKYDLNNLTIGGFSAGAGLALCVSATIPDFKNKIKAIVAIYPPGDFSDPPGNPPKGPPGSTAAVLDTRIIEWFNASYIQGNNSRADPRVSPLRADLSGYPRRVCIITGEYDNLRFGGNKLAENMREHGIDVHGGQIDGTGHAWDKTARNGTWEHDRKVQAYGMVLKFLEGVYDAKS